MDAIAQVGLVHTTGLAARLIQGVTHSWWNHMLVRTTHTRCIGAQPGGVRERLVSDFPETVWSRFGFLPPARTLHSLFNSRPVRNVFPGRDADVS